ncbi:hypothetical protein [Streptomyces sp. NPDC058614]|uniref:hypothetical protein n=1 Tax=Streptomyces sp. NPDC058614 TaxID=3346557 RepID=UPI00365575E1
MSENTTEPVPVTLDDEQLAQLAAAVTDGLAEYLVTEPVTALPAEVTVVVTEPVEETPQEPEAPEDGTQETTVPSVSTSTAPQDTAAVPPATDEDPYAGTDSATGTETDADDSGTEAA